MQERLLNDPTACCIMQSSGTFCLFANLYYVDYDAMIVGSGLGLDLQPIVGWIFPHISVNLKYQNKLLF